MTPRTLRQRLSFFVLLPVAVLLLGMGAAGFIYARAKLLDQWGEAAMLRLQRAAHEVDMRLNMPKIWLDLYQRTSEKPYAGWIQNDIIEQLKAVEGVSRVTLNRLQHPVPSADPIPNYADPGSQLFQDSSHGGMHGAGRQAITIAVSPSCQITCDAGLTVSLIADLKNNVQEINGSLEAVMPFDYLIETVKSSGWWQSNEAFLVDLNGRILAATSPEGRRQLGETGDVLELKVFEALKQKTLGIVFGPGFPVAEVSGFYRLQEAPWTLVMMAPAKEILSPMISFRNYYLIVGLASILTILMLIRWVTGKTVVAIKDVSIAAGKLANGDFGQVLSVNSRDEVGELTSSFNAMAHQLEERMRLKESLDLAKEVQQNLLPQQSINFCGLDIAGKSLYCDDTGGDYYDFLQFPELGENRIGVAVGDVADHGISAALLMTTTRALLRSRIIRPGTLSQIVGDVNRLLGVDTALSGNFMTLFVMVIDCKNKCIQWVRAGHDAAEVYDPVADSFRELGGSGMALGVDDAWNYQEYQETGCTGNEIILIGTDGIWETENPMGERFGKERLRRIIRQWSRSSSSDMIDAVLSAITDFRQTSVQADDITLVVVKGG
ncbi:MAG: SpoIIE family protein phosphatase [Deltaproteobacteria bacterium]|nr:SpoIIE family protein phosphatase [Deltaproteobacteria bacterium]